MNCVDEMREIDGEEKGLNLMPIQGKRKRGHREEEVMMMVCRLGWK